MTEYAVVVQSNNSVTEYAVVVWCACRSLVTVLCLKRASSSLRLLERICWYAFDVFDAQYCDSR